MCGIVCYVGRRPAAPLLLDGLKRLEYRGYDSAGLAVLDGGEAQCVRSVGKIAALEACAREQALPGNVGIAHTRWATHGKPTEANAHPHRSCKGRVFVSIPGHYSWSFDDPLFRLLLLRGVCWAAGEPADRLSELATVGAAIGD